jgi:hypothetical protein
MALSSDQIVTEWNLRTGDSVKNVDELNKRIVAQQREEKKLERVRAELDKQTGGLNKRTKAFSDGLGQMVSAINPTAIALGAMAGAAYKVTGSIRETIDVATKWSGTVGNLHPQTKRLAQVTDNLISQPALSRLVEYQKQLGLSQKAVDAVAKASVEYARINKTGFDESLKIVTDAVVGGKIPALRRLGLNLDEISGTKSEKMKYALGVLADRFGDVGIKVGNVAEKHDQLKNKMEETRAEVGKNIIETKSYTEALEAWHDIKVKLVEVTGALAKGILNSHSELRGMNKSLEDYVKNLRTGGFAIPKEKRFSDWATGGKTLGGGGGMGGDAFAAMSRIGTINRPGAALDAEKAAVKSSGATAVEKKERIKPTKPTWTTEGMEEGKLNKLLYGQDLNSIDQVMMDLDRELEQKFEMIEKRSQERIKTRELENEAWEKQIALHKEVSSIYETMNEQFEAMAVGGLAQFTAGLWDAAEAAIAGGESIGVAMRKMLQAVLMGIAKQSTVQAIYQLAEGFAALATTLGVPNPKSIAHFSSAGKYAAAAVLAGGAGLGIAAASSGSATRSTSTVASARPSTSGGTSRSSQSSVMPSKQEESRPINVTVLFGEPGNPTAAMLARKQIRVVTSE